MSLQWRRRASLTLDYRVSDTGDITDQDTQMDMSAFRFRFRAERATLPVPGHAHIRIYNLSEQTAAALQSAVTTVGSKTRRTVTVQAGYEGAQFGTVFRGELLQARAGRESPVDTYVDLLAVDGDTAWVEAIISKPLAAGATVRDRIRVVAEAFKEKGVTYDESEWPTEIPDRALPRGCVLNGMGWQILHQLSEETGFSWSIQGGHLQIIMRDGFVAGEAVALNSKTGLIGLPEQTQGGIIARCLINPDITPGRLVKIDQVSIQQQQFNIGVGAVNVDGYTRPTLAADGIYRVLAIDYAGDTRGHEWYQVLTLLIPGQQLPTTLGILPR